MIQKRKLTVQDYDQCFAKVLMGLDPKRYHHDRQEEGGVVKYTLDIDGLEVGWWEILPATSRMPLSIMEHSTAIERGVDIAIQNDSRDLPADERKRHDEFIAIGYQIQQDIEFRHGIGPYWGKVWERIKAEQRATGAADTAQPTASAALGDGKQGEWMTALLQRIYDHFVTHGEWPRYYSLEIEMHDLHEIISGIDEGLLSYERPIQESSICFLTLKGIAKCKGSEEDIRNFLSVANLCAKRYIRDRTTFTVSNSDLVDELGMSEMEARRICELLSRGSVSFGNGTWTSGDHQRYQFRVIHGALHFEDVSSLEEYFEREARATNAQKGEAGGVRRLSQAQGTLTTEYRAKLRQNLTEHFNRDELRTLCFDLGIKHENLAADTIDGMARELVAYCERTGRVPELVEKCKGLRSKVAWEDASEASGPLIAPQSGLSESSAMNLAPAIPTPSSSATVSAQRDVSAADVVGRDKIVIELHEQHKPTTSPPNLTLKLLDRYLIAYDTLLLRAIARQRNGLSPQKLFFGVRLENAPGAGVAKGLKIKIEAHGRELTPSRAFQFDATESASEWKLEPRKNDGRFPAVFQITVRDPLYAKDWINWSGFLLEMIAGGTSKIELPYFIWWEDATNPKEGSVFIDVIEPEGNAARCACCECYWEKSEMAFLHSSTGGRSGPTCDVCMDRRCPWMGQHQLGPHGEW